MSAGTIPGVVLGSRTRRIGFGMPRTGRRLMYRAVLLLAAAGTLIGLVDQQTTARQTATMCGKGQVAITVPRLHIWPVSEIASGPGPALRDVMARQAPQVALTAVIAANPSLKAGGPMGNLPRASGGRVCLTLPTVDRVQASTLVLQGPAQAASAPQAASEITADRISLHTTTGRLTDVQLAAVAYRAGFRGQGLRWAVAVAVAESGGKIHARCHNPGSTDRGVWQINNVAHPEVTTTQADNPITAAQAAYRISRGGRDWHQWVTHQHGHDRQYLTRADRAARQIGA